MIFPESPRRLALWSLLFVNVITFPAYAQLGAKPTASAIQIAQANTESTGAGGTRAAMQLNADDAYRLALLKMKGHLSAARALLQLRAQGADHHLGQPLQNIFRDAKSELGRRSAPFTADILRELKHAVARDPTMALTAIESAVTAINGSFAQTGAMDAEAVLTLAAALLREAVAKYAEAVTDNMVTNIAKYQSGRGFVTEAEALVRHSSGLKGRSGHTELLEVVTLIRQAWPGIVPPQIVFDPPSVAARLDEAMAAMAKLR